MRTSLRTSAFAVVIGLSLAVSACSSPKDAASGAAGGGGDKTLSLAVAAEEPTSYDPALAGTGTTNYYQALYDTLIKREADGSYSPMLATEWTYNDDNTVLTLKLREGVTFTDGSTMDADVVVENLTRFPDAGGSDATQLAQVESVAASDPSTVVITLKQPDPLLVYSLSNSAGFIASGDAIAAGSESMASTPAGSGPYTLDTGATTVGSQYTFERKADYWGDELPFQKIVLKPIADVSAQLNALRSGQINGALLSNAASGQEAEAAGFNHIESATDFHGLTLFDRGGQKAKALGDARVRQAINYAIDRELLLKQGLLGEGTVTSSIWAQGSMGYDEELTSFYSFDPAKAKELLAEAGYADGFELTMPVVSIFDNTVLTLTQQMLADVGITVKYQDVEIADLFGQLQDGTWPSTFMQFNSGTDWSIVTEYVAKDANWNSFKSTDSTFDALIGEFPTADEARQTEISRQLNQRVVEEAWFAPFYFAIQQLYVDDTVTVKPMVGEPGPSLYDWTATS